MNNSQLPAAVDSVALPLPLEPLREVDWFSALLAFPPVKALVPLPLLALLAVPVVWFFRGTWRELDADTRAYRQQLGDRTDWRPAACLGVTAVALTLQEYYGGRRFYQSTIRGALRSLDVPWLRLDLFDQLLAYGWWVSARVLGYVVLPVAVWKLLFPKDSILDMGLRTRGFRQHLWIYGLCLAFVVPAMFVVAQQPDFGSYYPFYKLSSRSWFDLAAWECIYFLQFFALEFFFRGWMVQALRPMLGASAIFAMALPYCMIHFGKPYLEAHGAIVAGVVLGSLSAKTRSVYAGFLVHVTVALSMDLLSLSKRGALPTEVWPF